MDDRLKERAVEAMARELANQDCDACFDEPEQFTQTLRDNYTRRAWKLFHAAYNILREAES